MIKQKFTNLSLKSKIQAIIFSCILVVLCAGLSSTYFISRAYEKVLYQSLSQSLMQSATDLYDQLNYIDSVADLIFSSRTIQTNLANYKDSTSIAEKKLYANRIYTALFDFIFNSGDNLISYVSFYQNKELICTSNSTESIIPNHVQDDLITQAEKVNGSTTWVTDYSTSSGFFLVKELREIDRLSLDSLGVMVIKVDIEKLINSTTVFHSDYEDVSYLLFDKDTSIYHSPMILQQDAVLLKEQLNTDYKIISFDNRSFFAVHGFIKKYGWEYICAVSYSPIAQTIFTAIKLSLASLVFCILIVAFSSTRLLSSVTRHFDILIEKMKRFGNGCYKPMENIYDYSQRKDEIGLLHTNFDSMAHKVDTLIEESYVNELLKREAQIKSMESQMDPHFLYNTLDSINWRAKAIGANDISQITMSLGNLLRFTLSKKNTLFTLREELCVLENYITIQKMRYQKRLSYSFDVPDELLNCEIPRFTIQPLLENAIRYGLEEISETCFITVLAKTSEKNVLIEVKNNGSAFEENLLEKLLSKEVLPHGFGIGIINIHKRLQLTYGSEYGLKLYNTYSEDTEEEYAVAQIRLPKHTI